MGADKTDIDTNIKELVIREVVHEIVFVLLLCTVELWTRFRWTSTTLFMEFSMELNCKICLRLTEMKEYEGFYISYIFYIFYI